MANEDAPEMPEEQTSDLTPFFKSLILLIISAHEQITAMRIALDEAGVLTPDLKSAAMAQAKALWRQRRRGIEQAGSTDAEILQRFLEDFEGNVQ